jgi:hypothetical protein
MTPAQQIQDLFKPLVGQLVWNVHGGVGSFLTLEFGKPHLAIREPIEAKPERSAQARRQLERRRVHVLGDWHLWIQYSDWKVTVPAGSLESGTVSSSSDECLLDLDGQRLDSVASGSSPNSWKFVFDLGGALEVWPSTAYETTNHLWSLHSWDGDIAALRGDGTIDFEKAAPRED